MRGQLGKVLQETFESRLNREHPQFVKEKVAPNPLGLRLFVWRIKEGLNVFLMVFPSPKNDSFTIEAGSSDDLGFDNLEYFMSRDGLPPFKTRFRISWLYEPKGDYWWHLAREVSVWDDDFFNFVEDPLDECLKKLEPTVSDVFEKIEKSVIPYFSSLADSEIVSTES